MLPKMSQVTLRSKTTFVISGDHRGDYNTIVSNPGIRGLYIKMVLNIVAIM